MVKPDPQSPYAHLLNTTVRIGYYSERDGLDCIWLVMPNGEYAETTDHDHLQRYFRIDRMSEETDLFGKDREPMKPLH